MPQSDAQTDSMYRPPAVLWPCHDNQVAGCWLAHLCDAKHHWLPRAPSWRCPNQASWYIRKHFRLLHFCHLVEQLQNRAAARIWPAHLKGGVNGQILLGGCIVCQSGGISEVVGILPAATPAGCEAKRSLQ